MVQAPPRILLCTHAGDVRGFEEELAALLAGLDPAAVALCDVTDLVGSFARVERLAAAAQTLLAGRLEEAWKRAGHRSVEEQLAGIAGTSVSSARNALKTSKRLRALPATTTALRAGKLSAAKAEAIADAAAVAPDAEAKLLETAENDPFAKLRDDCLRAKAVDRDAAHKRIKRDRYAKEYIDAEGAWHFHARGPRECGALFRRAHGPIVTEMFKAAKAEDRREPVEAYRFDAFIELARRAAAPAPAEPGKKPKRPPANFTAIIRADIEALRRGHVEGDEVCDIAGLGPIPVSVARELLGDAILKLVITNGVDVLHVTHLGRSATVAQQVALWWLSPECTRLGCTRTQRLENDHREEWHKTHHTRLDELDPLCAHDHDLKTHHGWALTNGEGKRPMVPPDHPRHPKNKPRPPP